MAFCVHRPVASMLMKHCPAGASRFLAVLAFIAASSASAQIVTFNFTGSIDFIMERFPGTLPMNVNQPESDTYGFHFALGQQVTGSFSYDLAAVGEDGGEREQFANAGSISLQVAGAGYSYSVSDQALLLLYNDSAYSDGPDALEFQTSDLQGDIEHRASINLRDSSGAAFSTQSVPPSFIDLSAFTYHKVFLSLRESPEFLSTGLLSMTIQMDDVTLAAVPEPAGVAAAIGLAALGVVLVLRRRTS